MKFVRASDHSLLIVFGDEISLDLHRQVLRMQHRLRFDGLLNLHPAYASVLVSFDPLRTTHEAVEAAAAGIEGGEPEAPDARLVDIPVCYGGEFGPDLEEVARLSGLAKEQVIAAHSEAEYIVYFLGFAPGFPYLGGLPPALAVPRLAEPRRTVAAGSVAIGGGQTGIYPVATPGGWRLIGRTPLSLFDPAAEPPTLLQAGDRLRFRAIDRDEYDRLSRA
jgi:KipI family sensor histidine kinase inhibitor